MVDKFKKFILEQTANKSITVAEAKELLLELQKKEDVDNDIAIIGLSCKFTNCEDQHEYWNKLFNEESCFIPYTDERREYYRPVFDNPHYAEFLGTTVVKGDEKKEKAAPKAGFLHDIDKFDAAFFNIPPREAKFMDPAQRLFLQTAWSAIEDAGYGGNKITGSNTGVFVGRDGTSSTFYKFITENDPMHLTGTWEGILASRINYIFNLRGPSMVIDTACSSGLVSIHNACQSLRNKECDYAIAGGISIGTSAVSEDEEGSGDALTSVASNDNLVRTFDKKSTGTVFGEGVTAVLLKPLKKALADNDSIYAVIKGSAINNDGASNGITAPNPAAQEEVLLKAWKQANIHPETLSYIEAHGTGTLLGDPIEIKGLTGAFRKFTNKKQFCGIGSVKTNMGHLVGASGIAGALKVILSLKNKKLPASLNFDEPNPHINFTESPLYVVDQMREWESGHTPRRAGVSSFGFSGTNCHIVLEEAPVREEPTRSSENYHLLTLSCKNAESLKRLIKRYKHYANRETHQIEDICYTASTGRGHYDYRIVLMIKDLNDFKEQINQLDKAYTTGNLDQIYYGYHKIVSDKKTVKEPGEISAREKRELNEQMATLFSKIKVEKSQLDEAVLRDLCELYVRGADVNWEQFYQNESRQKVNLPVYPFEKKVFWGDVKVSKIKQAAISTKELAHPMFDRCVVESLHTDIYEATFDVKKHWVLSDHSFFGSYLLPGTAYLEIGRAIGEIYYPESSTELSNVTFLSPISLELGENKKVQYVVTKEKAHIELKIISALNEETLEENKHWLTHAVMKIIPNPVNLHHYYDKNSIIQKDDMVEIEVNKEEISSEKNVNFGPRWLNLNRVRKNNKEVYAELAMPRDLEKDLQAYPLHPGMLDNAVNAATQSFGRGGLYLPFSYKSIKLFAAMPHTFYSHIRKKEKDTDNLETITFDVTLFTEDGTAFIEIEDYTMKKVQIHTFDQANKLHHYYKVNWISGKEIQQEQSEINEKILFLHTNGSVSKNLINQVKTKHADSIEVVLGEAYEKISERQYVISNHANDFIQLLQEIESVQHIIYVSDTTDMTHSLSTQQQPTDTLFYLSKALIGKKGISKLTIIANQAHEVLDVEKCIDPSNAAMLGLAKVVSQELSHIEVKCIDLDTETESVVIYQEIMNKSTDFRVAYRKNERFIEELSKVDWDQSYRQDVQIKTDGAYLITGGTGGIGLAVAEYLAMNHAKNICLMNRSTFPVRESWDAILSESKDNKLKQIISKIRLIESYGSNVQIYSGNVSNVAETNAILEHIRSEFKKINGIFHAAGVAGDGMLFRKEKQTFDQVVSPKIEGTWILENLTKEDELDLFVLFSSIATLFGGQGQSDYVAANAYLDAFSSYRNAQGKHTISINWSAWNEVGMAVEYGVSDEVVLFKSISNSGAYQVFDEVLDLDLNHFIPAELNLQLLSTVYEQLPIGLSPQIKLALDKFVQNHSSVKQMEKNFKGKVILTGKDTYTDTEKALAHIYAAGLDLNEIDVFESFHAMGGDSIIAMELFKEIEQLYKGLVDISDMFSYPSIIEMAQFIDDKRVPLA